jgi:hypothetical protein
MDSPFCIPEFSINQAAEILTRPSFKGHFGAAFGNPSASC